MFLPLPFTGPSYAQTSLSVAAGASPPQQQRGEKSLGFFPSWKTLALASLATATAARAAAAVAAEDNKRNAYYLPPPRLLLDSQEEEKQQQQRQEEDDNDNSSMDIELSSNGNATKLAIAMDNSDVIDTIENEVARAHDLLDLELSGHGFRRSPSAAAATSMSQQQGSLYANMPAGVRSAIVASAAIVLTSLATLMVIFVACRWRQHRRRKSSYLKTYNAMKSKLPQASPSTVVACNSGNSCNCNGNGSNSCHNSHKLATVSCNTPVHHHHQQLLFKREGSTTLSTCSSSLTTTATSKAATAAAAAAATTTTTTAAAAATGGRGMGGVNSLALTLRSTHQKLNTMDPNSPEVQEYLFDTLRKTFEN